MSDSENAPGAGVEDNQRVIADKGDEKHVKFANLSLSLRSKFLMGTAFILLVVCFLSALLIYQRERRLLENSAYRETRLVMESVEASRRYVRETLRPRMRMAFGHDFFMLEGMSTSFVSREVMERFKSIMPEYDYRRVSVNARNPLSEANATEKSMISYFKEDMDRSEWVGMMDLKEDARYMRFQPIYFEDSCMSCHGDPVDAPAELINLYGPERGFGKQPGEMAGVIAVSVPVKNAMAGIQERATSVFLVVLFGVSVFYVMLIFFFNHVVINNLRGVLNLFKDEVEDSGISSLLPAENTGDELRELSRAASAMAKNLRQTRKQLEGYAQDLEVQVDKRTMALQESEQLLREKILARNRELNALNSIAELTTRAKGLADIWPSALSRTLDLIPAGGAGIYLYEAEHGRLMRSYEMNAPRLPLVVNCQKEDVSISGSHDEKDLTDSMCSALGGEMHGFMSPHSGRYLNIPLECRGKVLGVMTFTGLEFGNIPDEQQTLLRSIGNQIGIALESLSGLQRLIQSKELLQSVFDGITDLVVLLDKDYRIKMVNKGYLEQYEVEAEEVIGEPCYMVHAGLKGVCHKCDLNRVFEEKIPVSSETSCGKGKIHLVHFYPVFDENGEIQSVIRYSRDITRQKKVEQRIQHTEKLVAVGQLAAGVAHEINNPLGIMLCYLDLLKRQLTDYPQGLKDLYTVEKQTLNCKRIITDLLQFARGEESEKEPVDINSLIIDVAGIFNHQFKKQKVRLNLHLDEQLAEICLDADKFKQVMVNLLMNALQALDGPGEVRISTDYLQKRKSVRIVVADNGPGMAAEIRDKIFDPFFSTKKTGESTGLGLSVSYGIIKEHGGEIFVLSEPGKGAQFVIVIPVDGLEGNASHD
jgi:two-component system, NtrC family, sensor kinase